MHTPTNRTLPLVRVVAGLVLPVLIYAFFVLYFTPDQSGERFAWLIKPHMSSVFIGSGYLGGGFLLLQAARGLSWHRVQHGFPLITIFTASMFVATILHWDRFDLNHFPFQLWLALYIVSPFLIGYLWLKNRREDPGTLEPDDRVVPPIARRGLVFTGILLGFASLTGWFAPDILIGIWPWQLTPLTARVFAGWFALLAAGGVIIGFEKRWSAWREGMTSIFIWHFLVAIGGIWNLPDFGETGYFNWYITAVWIGLAVIAILYIRMSVKTSKSRPVVSEPV